MRRSRMSPEGWVKLVEEYEGARLAQKEFAALAGVSVSRLQYWLYKTRRQRAQARKQRPAVAEKRPREAVAFVEVQPAAPERIEIELPSGVRVRLAAATEARVVGEVTRALCAC